VSASGIFLTHQKNPRIRQHFQRLVEETGSLVTWHFVYSQDAGARPTAPFPTQDPAQVMAARYAAMERNGGVQGGFLDTLLLPLFRALQTDHVWSIEYDVDYAGDWAELFGRFADNRADLLTTTVLPRTDQPDWPWWSSASSPAWVPEDSWLRSLNPLMRLSRRLVNAYCVAMADASWQGHYEFTLPTVASATGCVVEDFGGEGPFVPPGRERSVYVGKSAAGRPDDLTFGFRPVRPHYFHEEPGEFETPGLVYHPIKPGVAAWSRATMNTRD
jgi:hypothetical protein